MSPKTAAPSETLLLIRALLFPLKRKLWWCACTLLMFAVILAWTYLLFGSGRRGGYLLYGTVAMTAMIVRFYVSALHSTITGYGEQIWMEDAFLAEDYWSTFWDIVVVTAISFCPALVWFFVAVAKDLPVQPWLALLSMLGCYYFCMALVSTAMCGSLSAALPHVVLPAMKRGGILFTLAGWALLMIPTPIHWVISHGDRLGWGLHFVVALVTSYLMLAHANLIGLLYHEVKYRLGWE